MRVKFSPYFIVGSIILVGYLIVENLIVTIPGIVAVPLLLFALTLIIIDGIKRRAHKEK
ncbi:hypothetical protein [Proteiniclasticum ruminis]|uniref:Uncharacterized protein n=1 Tax=Proteiniclasticum ruminis TaxID=398199 RepID=A0A1I4Y8F9_9CLOT|nr:hypothetical protein [Proteiniclasticum ruminis]SFN34285.1 hypothetical protein SAMN04488695_101458 [Proteiniclasticum ruminis]